MAARRQSVVITGAGSGIGRAASLLFTRKAQNCMRRPQRKREGNRKARQRCRRHRRSRDADAGPKAT